MAARFQVGHHGQHPLSHFKPVACMADAGYGYVFNADHRDQAASDIYKCSKLLQMGNGGLNDLSGQQFLPKPGISLLLYAPAGQQPVRSVPSNDAKANRLANTGQDRDLPHFSPVRSQSCFGSGYTAPFPSQPHIKVTFFVTHGGHALQNHAPLPGLQQPLCAFRLYLISSFVQQTPFRQIDSLRHFMASSFCISESSICRFSGLLPCKTDFFLYNRSKARSILWTFV